MKKININNIKVGDKYTYVVKKLSLEKYSTVLCNGAMMLNEIIETQKQNPPRWIAYNGFIKYPNNPNKGIIFRSNKDMMEVNLTEVVEVEVIGIVESSKYSFIALGDMGSYAKWVEKIENVDEDLNDHWVKNIKEHVENNDNLL